MPQVRYLYDGVSVNYTNTTTAVGNMSVQYETPEAIQNDNDLLNFALHVEHFGGAFYNGAMARFNVTDFLAAGYNASVFNHFQLIVLHENTHAAFLTSVITSRNASVIPACVYNLTSLLASVQSVLNFSRLLENNEVAGYDGAIQTLTDAGLVETAATIATIEARHAGWLNYLLLNQPILNQTRDSTFTPQQVLAFINPYIASCPQQPTIPQPYYLFAAAPNSSAIASFGSSPSAAASFGSSPSAIASFGASSAMSNSAPVVSNAPSNSPTSISYSYSSASRLLSYLNYFNY